MYFLQNLRAAKIPHIQLVVTLSWVVCLSINIINGDMVGEFASIKILGSGISVKHLHVLHLGVKELK